MNGWGRIGAVLALCVGLVTVAAGEECVASKAAAGGYSVEIAGKQYSTVTREEKERVIETARQLASTQEKLRLCDAALAKADTAIRELEALSAQQKVHIETLDAQIVDLTKAKAALEAMVGGDKLVFEAGLGANTDEKAVGLAGVGYGVWRVWGYASDGGTKGLMVGRQF